MLFPTFTFFVFFLVALFLNWQLKKWPLLWRIFLLATSYFFYGIWNYNFLFLIIVLTGLSYLSAVFISRSKIYPKLFLAVGIGANLLVLVFFKYFDSLRIIFDALANIVHLSPISITNNIILPIGLSFYVLRIISFLIEIYRKNISLAPSFLDYSIYVSFFPQLLSGPISRPNEFLPQLINGGAKTIDNIDLYFTMILTGLFKKLVLASYLSAAIVDNVFSVPQNHSSLAVLIAIYAYSVVIYCDFSGYTDMAIGLAGLMGFKSPINFNAPYRALSVADFWRRWHISLSSWLRDYLYIPLGGNRLGDTRKYVNLMATMLISGLWHGSGLNYLFWGFWHGVGVVFGHILPRIRTDAKLSKIGHILHNVSMWLITFNFISFGWIFFRSKSISDGLLLIRQLFNYHSPVEAIPIYAIYLTVIAIILFIFEEQIKSIFAYMLKNLGIIVKAVFIAAIVIIILNLGPDIVPSFIYFSF
ncbi:MAG: MBOAT family O-acyltransferase [bacterium]